MAEIILDTNDDGTATSSVDVIGKTMVEVYIFHKTGTHNNHRVALQISPDGGVNWVTERSHLGVGRELYGMIATHVRVCVTEPEGETSTIGVHILAG